MTVRHLTLVTAMAFGIAVASPAAAQARDCPSSDSPDATAQGACDDTMPAVDDPTVSAADASVPTVDADGDAIPFVEETLAPEPGTSLVFSSDGE